MSAIIILSDTELHKEPVASDKVTVYTDGYRDYFDNTTTVTVADIVTASGLVTLSHAYVVGRNNLLVSVNGISQLKAGPAGGSTSLYDYTEENETQIQLGDTTLQLMTDYPLTTKLEVRWNKPLPGVRDQLLENLQDVPPDLSAAVRDLSVLRTSPATAANVLITQDDLDTAIDNFAGLTLVPVATADRLLCGYPILGIGTSNQTFDFKLDNAGASFNGGVSANNSAYGGSGNPIAVPANARWMLVNVMVDVDHLAAPLGSIDASAFAVRFGGTATQVTNRVARVSLNSGSENNATDYGTILVEMNNPANPTGDLNVTISVITPGTINMSVGVRLDGFYIEEQP